MRKTYLLGMAAALMVFATAALAYPNLSATTGLIGVPNANIVAPGQFVAAADLLAFDDSVINGRVVYGIGNNFEAGAGVALGDETGFILGAKYRTGMDTLGMNWSVGANYQSDGGSGTQVYLVGTRGMPNVAPEDTQFLGTIGVSFTDVEELTGIRPFVGGQLVFSPRTEVGAEFLFEAGDFDESISSLYLRHRINPRWIGEIGFTNANGFVGTSDHDLFIGAALDITND